MVNEPSVYQLLKFYCTSFKFASKNDNVYVFVVFLLIAMFPGGSADCIHSCTRPEPKGWSGGAMRLTNLDDSTARAYCACSRCGWGLFGHFFSRLSFLFSFSLSLGDGPGPLSPKQPTNRNRSQSFGFTHLYEKY